MGVGRRVVVAGQRYKARITVLMEVVGVGSLHVGSARRSDIKEQIVLISEWPEYYLPLDKHPCRLWERSGGQSAR